MTLHDTLRFVRGAVATKDLVPEMTHFVIEGGRVRSFNGALALSAPIDFVDCKPKAVPLVNAISNCDDVMSMDMLSNGRLRIQSGNFRAVIDCIEGEMPHQTPSGEFVDIDGAVLLRGLETVHRFIGTDASRPWSNGVFLHGQSAYATNNVCLVEYWLGVNLPFTINIPAKAINEVLRIGEPPERLQLAENSVTFHYSDQRWIRSLLLDTKWPNLNQILDKEANPSPIVADLFEGLEALKPFAGDLNYIHFRGDEIATEAEEEATGARYRVEGLGAEGSYKLNMMRLLEGVATHVDFTRFPQPALFFGENLRGAIMGVRI